MNDHNTKIITEYIAVWMWHLVAVVCLSTSIVLYFLHSKIFFIGFFLGFLLCEIVSYVRRKEFYEQ